MTKDATDRYLARMRRALHHIDCHLDTDLDLDTVSAAAAFSKFHFHRQFQALLGLSPHRYVQLARLKRASYRLAFRRDESVTDIALDAGYEAPDAFARAFRARFGQAPAAFRQTPDWMDWQQALSPLHQARTRIMEQLFSLADVEIVDFPATPVAIMEHHGDPAELGTTIRRFINWRRSVGLPPRISATFTLFHTDPRVTPSADYRLDLCAATPTVPGSDPSIRAGTIDGGRCARLRVIGRGDDLEPAALFLYRDWLPASGEEPRDFPLFAQRIRFFPDVAEHEAVTDLFLPLRG